MNARLDDALWSAPEAVGALLRHVIDPSESLPIVFADAGSKVDRLVELFCGSGVPVGAHDALVLRAGDSMVLHASAADRRNAVPRGGIAGLGETGREAVFALLLGDRLKADGHPWGAAMLAVGGALFMRLCPLEVRPQVKRALLELYGDMEESDTRATTGAVSRREPCGCPAGALELALRLDRKRPPLDQLLSCSPEADGVCTARFLRGRCMHPRRKRPMQKRRGSR